eukprot:13974869-Alexandrium_andersonii.AAC.1
MHEQGLSPKVPKQGISIFREQGSDPPLEPIPEISFVDDMAAPTDGTTSYELIDHTAAAAAILEE